MGAAVLVYFYAGFVALRNLKKPLKFLILLFNESVEWISVAGLFCMRRLLARPLARIDARRRVDYEVTHVSVA